MTFSPHLTLASTSPRRHQLIRILGWQVEVRPVAVNEERLGNEDAVAMVTRLAVLKARAHHAPGTSISHDPAASQRHLIVGADTTVEVDGKPLGKPVDFREARDFLNLLRGREHQVHSGLCVLDMATGWSCTRVHISRVSLRAYSEGEMQAYIESGTALDKAGGYALQDRHFQPVVALEGCAASVMGLPVALLADMCQTQFACSAPMASWPRHCSRLTGHACCRRAV